MKDYTTPFVIAFFVLIIAVIFSISIMITQQKSTETITITDKEVVSKPQDQGGGNQYLIFSENNSYEVADSILNKRFDSSSFYAKLKLNVTYTCKMQGVRVPLLSMRKNILDCSEVKK